MSELFESLHSLGGLEEALLLSEREPVVLFNHDPWCPISARAHRIMSTAPFPVMLIDVSRHRDVTRELAARTGVRHESPQVIVLRDRAARWDGSHNSISVERVTQARSESGAN